MHRLVTAAARPSWALREARNKTGCKSNRLPPGVQVDMSYSPPQARRV